MAAAYQFKPLVGGGAQRAPIQNQRAQPTSKSGLAPSAGMNVDIPEGAKRDSALRATFVDKEEAAMLRAMARLNGDDAKSRDFGNRNSQVNRKKSVARQKEAAAMGLTPLDPHEQHELQKKMDAGYTTISERGIRVPRVGVPAPRPRPAMIDIIVHRKSEEEIREEYDGFERPQAPPGRPVRSVEDKKDELALRNQFNGRLPHEVLGVAKAGGDAAGASSAPPPPPRAPNLKEQIEDEVAERHEFLDGMRHHGKLDRPTQVRIEAEIADRMHDLKRLHELGADDAAGA